MSTEQNKSIVRRYIEEVWGRGQFATLREVVDRDVVDHQPAPGQPCGLEGQEWVARSFLGALTNQKLTTTNLLGSGDRVFDSWTFSATQTGEFFGMPPTGKRFTISGMDESRIANGKIVEMWHHEDMLSLMQQLGYAPSPQLPQSFGRPATATTRPTQSGQGTTPSERDLTNRIRQGYRDMLDKGDFSTIEKYIAPDFVGHYSGFPPVYGLDGFRQFLSLYTGGLSDRRTDIQDILVDGDKVALRLVYHGKNTGSMLGTPATGKTIETPALTILRMVGDKAVEQWANNDDIGMMQQLGAIPEMAQAQATPC